MRTWKLDGRIDHAASEQHAVIQWGVSVVSHWWLLIFIGFLINSRNIRTPSTRHLVGHWLMTRRSAPQYKISDRVTCLIRISRWMNQRITLINSSEQSIWPLLALVWREELYKLWRLQIGLSCSECISVARCILDKLHSVSIWVAGSSSTRSSYSSPSQRIRNAVDIQRFSFFYFQIVCKHSKWKAITSSNIRTSPVKTFVRGRSPSAGRVPCTLIGQTNIAL